MFFCPRPSPQASSVEERNSLAQGFTTAFCVPNALTQGLMELFNVPATSPAGDEVTEVGAGEVQTEAPLFARRGGHGPTSSDHHHTYAGIDIEELHDDGSGLQTPQADRRW